MSFPRRRESRILRTLLGPRLREDDHGTPPEAARAIHQNLKGSELKIIPSAAHLSNIEQTQLFNDAMMGFLNRVAR